MSYIEGWDGGDGYALDVTLLAGGELLYGSLFGFGEKLERY